MTTVLTPTCDRPVAFALAEEYMRRQTLQPDEWIVVDGGEEPTRCTLGQTYIHQPSPPGARNLARNLLVGLALVKTDILVCWEDDDWYHPTHLERLLGQLRLDGVLLAGDPSQRYYNVAQRKWRVYKNRGSCLCQTGMHRSLIPTFQKTIERCLQANSYGIDGRFWSDVSRRHWDLVPTLTCLGIKGLPGRQGLGVGHRPDRHWRADPNCTQLQAWIGAEDAARYQCYRTIS